MQNIERIIEMLSENWIGYLIFILLLLFAVPEIWERIDSVKTRFGYISKDERRFLDLEERIENLESSAKHFHTDRIHDREQSREVQKALLAAIESIKIANRVSLGDRINERYKYYTKIQGIPEDELDEFVNLHDAYNGVGGNHGGDKKFEKAMKYRIIPLSEIVEKGL